MKNSEFKVGSIVVVDCDSPSIKYKVTKQTKEGMYVEVYETNQYNHQHGPYNDTGIIRFKLDPYTKQFFPEPGDTIVCNDGTKFTCFTREEYIENGGNYRIANERVIFGHTENDKSSRQSWINHKGETNYSSTSDHDYDIKEIIPMPKKKVNCLSKWIPWFGGQSRVPRPSSLKDNTIVEVTYRCGDIHKRAAAVFRWNHLESPYDIVAYRIIKQETETKTSVTEEQISILTLEKENQFLRALLRKQGVDI